MDHIHKNWQLLRERIAQAAARAGRDPAAIEVVAVSKKRGASEVEAAYECGLRIMGENRIQEATAKRSLVATSLSWHMIGHLQTNKAGQAVECFDLVQSVDSGRLARALDRRAGQAGRVLEVLLQVNTSGSEAQSGVEPGELTDLVTVVAPFANLQVRGLMTIGAHSDDEAVVRGCFRKLRELSEEIAAGSGDSGVLMDYLSMGMSGDFELAIEEGANLLRLGTAIFGSRPT